jgi:Protein kinase domain
VKECLVPQPVSPPTLPPGAVLAKRYRIEQLIGSGGYASVYRATDLTLGYERAIKEVTDPDPAVRNQFRLEAELLINSKHPNIPHGYHLIEDRERLYLVMDYVHGKDLEEMLNESLTQRQRPLDEAQVLKWAVDICGALDEMHNLRVPVIHRDIKPANIKITPDGMPILIDFGLAKLHQKGPTMTAAQGVSPGFAPPEQYMAKGRTDPRTDIYGLGATLYACLTGKDPPEAPGRLMAQAGPGGPAGMQLVSVRKLNPRVSDETDRIVIRALELSPGNRQQTAQQMRAELVAALQRLGGAVPATLGMGPACPRCGTQNRPDADRCVNCNAPLRPLGGQNGGPGVGQDGTGKRAVVGVPAGAGGVRAVGKAPAVAARVAVPPPGAASQLDPRTGRQPVVAGERMPRPLNAPDDQRSGKQRAVAARGEPLLPPVPGAGARATAVVPALPSTAVAPLSGRATGQVAVAGPSSQALPVEYSGAWIKLGETPVTRFGKVMLALAGVEVLWGTMVVTLGLIVLSYGHQPLPVPQLVIGWVALVLIASVVGAQTLTRPVLRRGRMTNARRWVQGTALTLYSLAVQAAGIYGAFVFQSNQPNPQLAVVAYLLFGISTLLAGGVGIFTALG